MKRKPFRKRLRGAATGAPAVLLVLFVALVLLARQNHRSEQLRQENSRLRREVDFAAEQLQRTRAHWHAATARESILPRAARELGLVEPDAQARYVVLGRPADEEFSARLFARIRRGLDRYGRIDDAVAAEEPQP